LKTTQDAHTSHFHHHNSSQHLGNARASASHGTQPQPLSEVPLRRWFTNKKEWQSLQNLYSHKAIMKPRHLSERLLPENKHPGSRDYWTDNISEVYFSIWEGTLLLLHCVCSRYLWILSSDVQPLVRLVYEIVYFGLHLLLFIHSLRFALATPYCNYLNLNR
ncbi:hypothetical protein PIB30_060858, partial [Stylosanthes scabra]|nr:hypothetical protein [Stylosanthes scabra]